MRFGISSVRSVEGDLKGTRSEDVDCINLALGRLQWRALVNVTVKLQSS